MTKILFNSNFSTVGRMHKYSQEVIKKEPMFFSASLEYAKTHGGEIVKEFIAKLPDEFKKLNCILDSRTHMLMADKFFPCIPGFHLDDVPRTRSDGQPDHVNPSYKAEHISVCVGDASLTKFILGKFELEDVPIGKGIVYEKWNGDIEKILKKNEKDGMSNYKKGFGAIECQPPECSMIKFNSETFHRGSLATKNGWRHFIRVSINTPREIVNETRNQVQVYLNKENGGW